MISRLAYGPLACSSIPKMQTSVHMVWATPSARVSLWQGLAQVANRLQVSHSGPEGTFTVAPAELSLVPYVFDTMPLPMFHAVRGTRTFIGSDWTWLFCVGCLPVVKRQTKTLRPKLDVCTTIVCCLLCCLLPPSSRETRLFVF